MYFTRNAHFVAEGYQRGTTEKNTYASVVSREMFCTLLLLAALNDVGVIIPDIQGAYLNAPSKDNLLFRPGAEFDLRKGLAVVVFR